MDIDPQPPKKRKKGKNGYDELDDLLIRNLKYIEERRDGEEELYARQVAATLRRLTKRQQAIAKLRIQGVLLDIEFPEEPITFQ